jgi:hypothetical protein
MPTKNPTINQVEETRESRRYEQMPVHDLTVEALIREAEQVTTTPTKPEHQPAYPAWPTSAPGPQTTTPPDGMRPVARRTDQMVYECYDQERGQPCIALPAKRITPPGYRHPVTKQVKAGLDVYDAQGARVGKILVRFPRYLLVEQGLIIRRTYYIPVGLVRRVEGQRVMLAVSEATLIERGYTNAPGELYHTPRAAGGIVYPDISAASQLGKFPPTPAETGHYHYGPYSPGINTDAGGSYAPHEIDPYGRPGSRSTTLYMTGEEVRPRTV